MERREAAVQPCSPTHVLSDPTGCRDPLWNRPLLIVQYASSLFPSLHLLSRRERCSIESRPHKGPPASPWGGRQETTRVPDPRPAFWVSVSPYHIKSIYVLVHTPISAPTIRDEAFGRGIGRITRRRSRRPRALSSGWSSSRLDVLAGMPHPSSPLRCHFWHRVGVIKVTDRTPALDEGGISGG